MGAAPGNNADTVAVVTDDAGQFTAHGLLPGTLYITVDKLGGGWVRELPPGGLAPLNLQIPAHPIRLLPDTTLPYAEYWWIPARGKAHRVFGFVGNLCADFDFTGGEGWLWAVNARLGFSNCWPVIVGQVGEKPQALSASIRPVRHSACPSRSICSGVFPAR